MDKKQIFLDFMNGHSISSLCDIYYLDETTIIDIVKEMSIQYPVKYVEDINGKMKSEICL